MTYLAEKVRRMDLLEVIRECRTAAIAGRFSDNADEQAFIGRVRQSRDFSWFSRERRSAYDTYDAFCAGLEQMLPIIESISDPRARLRHAVPLLEQALVLDGRRRAFDQAYNGDDTIATHYTLRLREHCAALSTHAHADGAVRTLTTIAPELSFELFQMTEFLQLLAALAIPRTSFEQDALVSALRRNATTALPCAMRYTRNDLTTLARRLQLYRSFAGKERETLMQIAAKAIADARRKEELTDALAARCASPYDAQAFRELVNVNTQLVYFNSREDQYRKSLLDGLQDYILRDLTARALHDLGVLHSPKPTDHPQYAMLAAAKTAL